MWRSVKGLEVRYRCASPGRKSIATTSADTALTPVQHTEHEPRGKPLLLSGQSLQFPWASASLKEIIAIFAPIDEACTPFTAGPKVRDRVSTTANSGRTTLNDMNARYLLTNWIARAAFSPRKGGSNFSVRHVD